MGNLSALTPHACLGRAYSLYEQAKESSWGRKLCFETNEKQDYLDVIWTGSVPPPAKWTGSRRLAELATETKRITNDDYETSIRVRKEWFRRAVPGNPIQKRISELAMAAADLPSDLVETILGANTSYTCRDGQYLFDTDHSSGLSGTQTNSVTTTEVTCLNVTTSTAPTAQEAANCIAGLIGYMKSFKNDQGKARVNLDAKKFLVVCPTVNIYAPCLEAVTSRLFAVGADNPLSLMAAKDGLQIEVIHAAALASATTSLWVFRLDTDAKAFVLCQEQEPEFSMLEEGSDHAFFEREYLYAADQTVGIAPYNWDACILGTLS